MHVCVCARAWEGCGCTSACLRACGLNYLACNAPPYCHLRPLWLHHICPPYFINGTIFGKKLRNIKCVFWFSLRLLFETFIILRIIQRDVVIMWKHERIKYLLFVADFIATRIYLQIFTQKLRYQVLSKSVQWEPNVPCGLTDRQTRRRYKSIFAILRTRLKVLMKFLLQMHLSKPFDLPRSVLRCRADRDGTQNPFTSHSTILDQPDESEREDFR